MTKNTSQSSSKFVKNLRKWSRIIHRDIGFFFIGASIIYGLSGLALNHLKDWNPNYSVSINSFHSDVSFQKGISKDKLAEWITNQGFNGEYKTHYYPEKDKIKIYLTNNITIYYDLASNEGTAETLKRRPIFYQTNHLHYNPNKWWKWFSDAFAVSLIIFAITSLFMVRGKKGAWGRGGIYIFLGILIPLLILFLT